MKTFFFLDRLTEICENDVYICESKYVTNDHSIRPLSKGLKVKQERNQSQSLFSLSLFIFSRERHYH